MGECIPKTTKDFNICSCPKCGTRLICGISVKGCIHQCGRCKRHWHIEMDAEHVTVRRSPSFATLQIQQ